MRLGLDMEPLVGAVAFDSKPPRRAAGGSPPAHSGALPCCPLALLTDLYQRQGRLDGCCELYISIKR